MTSKHGLQHLVCIFSQVNTNAYFWLTPYPSILTSLSYLLHCDFVWGFCLLIRPHFYTSSYPKTRSRSSQFHVEVSCFWPGNESPGHMTKIAATPMFYRPQLRRSWGGILVWACRWLCLSVTLCMRSRTDRILKSDIWKKAWIDKRIRILCIPSDLSLQSYAPFSALALWIHGTMWTNHLEDRFK